MQGFLFNAEICYRCSNNHIILEILEDILKAKGDLVYLHSVQVSQTAFVLAEHLGHPDPLKLRIAGLFHDLGKIYVPDYILNKDGVLTEREREIIKMHPLMGSALLQKCGFSEIADIILYHHERPDGSGYPYGTTKVPYESMLVAVADVFVALSNYRPYKPAYPVEEAIRIVINTVVQGYFKEREIKYIQEALSNGKNR